MGLLDEIARACRNSMSVEFNTEYYGGMSVVMTKHMPDGVKCNRHIIGREYLSNEEAICMTLDRMIEEMQKAL